MKVLVMNCGSSSIKYQLFNMNGEETLAKGLVERIGLDGAVLTHRVGDKKIEIKDDIQNHKVGVKLVLEAITNTEYGVIKDMSEIKAVGHRVVHGGEKYANSVLIDDEVMKSIEECVKLAPLHNPPNIIGIKACQELMENVPMVAVFDTAFHQTMKEVSYIYPLPYKLYEEDKIRRYGFHGTSHKYVSNRAAEFLGEDTKNMNIITCHLGNGASITAIEKGESIDTSMGFTPLEGLCMGTRSGDFDPSIIPFLMEQKGMSSKEINDLMNKESGLLGVSGISSDCRDIEEGVAKGDKRAKLAYDIFCNKIIKYIGSYAVLMDSLDAIVFTGGIGENADSIRGNIANGLKILGVEVDDSKNDGLRGKEAIISSDNSKVKVLVIPTDEELMIARDTKTICFK